MRADRLIAIILLLQRHGQLTVATLAEQLEASERTIRRDLEALLVAGVPLSAQRGRGGGWALAGRYRLDLTGLTADEAAALFVSSSGGTARLPGLESALRKVRAALPEALRDAADRARAAVLIDQAAWGATQSEEPVHLATLRAAVLARCQVDVLYARPGTEATLRRLHPHGLIEKRGVWYLLASAETGVRTYRVERVEAVTTRDEPAVAPEGFELGRAWAAAQDGLAERLACCRVVVRVAPGARRRLAEVLAGWCRIETDEPVDDEGAGEGAVRLVVSFPSVASAAGALCAFTGRLVVEDPPELRRALAQLGEELRATYAAPASAR